MNIYRTHNCNELLAQNSGEKVRLSGWIHKKRDHGNLLFIDLRDNYGITQCVVQKDSNCFIELEKLRLETVVSLDGLCVKRSEDAINNDKVVLN